MAAALAASRAGAEVHLFEKGRALGRKVLASGGGRCNLGNRFVREERYHGEAAFVRGALSRFGAKEAGDLFESLGLLLAEEEEGRLFPRCGRSDAVVEVFQEAFKERSVRVRLDSEVSRVRASSRGWSLELKGKAPVPADAVILACGGAAQPRLGGGEGGYRLARELGHGVSRVTPALVPLCAKDYWVKQLKGLRCRVKWKGLDEREGEMLFTGYGVSGPVVLDSSRDIARALERGPVRCAIGLFPGVDLEPLLRERSRVLGSRPLGAFLTGMLPSKLIRLFLESHRLRPEAPVPERLLGDLAAGLQAWSFDVVAPGPFDDAMVSAGGVEAAEVDASDFRSRKAGNLFLTGELLDVDADSGGFNLHFAWGSGTLAGRAAAR
jgi:predicted Rossmann fold flavoprotein